MRKTFLLLLLTSVGVANAQKTPGIYGENNWFNGWTSFKPKTAEYAPATQILTGVIKENTTLSKRNTYLLMGTVYVPSGVTLTIEPGTVIRGDSDSTGTLTVVKGGKIIAEGTETDPIVFTSNKSASDRKAGDWGGIIIYGDAPLNRHGGLISSIYDTNPLYNVFGGNNENSDSGVLKYVRIEFAGKKIDAKTMLNGLTLGAVGKKTKVEFVQISFAKDDGIEIVGGNVDFNNIISYRNADDDFDFSMGIQSTVNNSIVIRSPFISDNTRSRAFEIDSYDKVENFDPTKKKTVIKLNNVTIVNNDDNSVGLVKEAISLKSDSFLEMNRCVVSGFASFVALDDKYLEADNFKKISIKECIADSCIEVFTNENLVKQDNVNNWFNMPSMSNTVSKVGLTNLFKSNDEKKKPDFRLK